MKTAQEHLEKFLETVKKKPSMEMALSFLTKTQQHEANIIGGQTPQVQINSLYTLLQYSAKGYYITALPGNEVKMDFKIVFDHNIGHKLHYKIRLIKEIAVRKADKTGEWGVNINSLRLIK